MKILYCIDSLVSSGGTERVLSTKANWISRQKEHSVWIVTLTEEGVPFFPLDSNVKRIMLNLHDVCTKEYRFRLSEVLDEIRPDVCVAVAGMSVDVLPSLNDNSLKVMEFHYTKNFLVNFVNGMKHDKFHYLRLAKMYYLQWKLARKAKRFDLLVGLTRRDVGLWGNPRNMTYIYNPLSFRTDKKSTCERKQIIAVGSWTPAKGMDQLLYAFGKIAHKYPDWTVSLYGRGQDENLLRSIIKEYRMENQVFLHYSVPNIKEKLIESSIYAFPSRSDGFGLVITEAMECGLPTVAMDCECGPREIVTSTTGIVVPDKGVDEFSKALEKLMKNEDLRKSMGQAAQKEVHRFYVEQIMPQWIKLFESYNKK